MFMRSVLALLTLSLLSGCVEPVIRRNQNKTDEVLTPPGYDKADLKKRIWIVPFTESIAWDPKQGADPELSKSLLANMKQIFSDAKGPFLIAKPFDQGLDDSQANSDNSDEDLKSIAQASGADGYLKGTVVTAEVLRTELPDGLVKTNEFRVVLRVAYELYDAYSGRLLFRGQEEDKHVEQRSDVLRFEFKYPEIEKRLQAMSKKVALKIYHAVLPASARMGWTGRVLSVENARVFLNAGEKTGIRMGDILKVVEPFKQIADFQSGKLVGNVPGRIKGTIKIIQFFGDDGAVGVLQSGGGFSPGDNVQLY
ncbi:MAG TPA: hypothetical protein VM901_11830 [Bdellovibrionota bacterium]|jgi:hypothetical protein|nr:hypothetical protein [Bdellovibrionota bacterium]